MQREFLYFLTNETGATYHVDNGVVKESATELKPLPVNPDGWNDKLVNFGRNNTYYGIFRSFTIPMKFVKDGARILREKVWKFGFEFVMFLVILRLDKNAGTYQSFYKAEIDFAKTVADRISVEATVMEGGLPKYLKAYEGTMQEIPLEGDGVVIVKMDGVQLDRSVNYEVYNIADLSNTWHTLPCAMVNEEGTSFGMLAGDSSFYENPIVAIDEERWILKNVGNVPVDVKLIGTVIASLQSSSSSDVVTYAGYLQRSSGPTVTLWNYTGAIGSTGIFPPGGVYNVNAIISLAPGERLFLLANLTGAANRKVGYTGGSLKATFKTKFKTTYIKAIKPFVVAEKLVKGMAGSGYSLVSSILENSDIYLTCGDAIRGIAGAKLKTSFKDFFTSYNRNLCLGLSYKGAEVQIRERAEYYQTGSVYDLGNVKNAEFSFEENLIANKIKVGYPNQDYDDVNGREEFNNTHEYKAPITRVAKEYDLTAPYRADMYGIEFIRINLEGKTTTDSSGDNDIFMIVVEKDTVANDGTYQLKRPAFDSIDGLIDPSSAFNIELSPKRIMQKHGAWIRGMMWPYDSKYLTFQSTPKNSKLKTTKGSEVIQENADILIGSLPAPYLVPISVRLETVVPDDLLQIMEANSYSLFRFTYEGKQFTFWAEDCKQKPSDDAAQEWKGLLCADNNLNDLIHG